MRALVRPRTVQNVTKTPVPLASTISAGGMFGSQTSTGMYEFMSVYGRDAVVYPIVAKLAESVAATRWRLYRKAASGDPQDRTEITSHAILDLLAHPNDFQTFQQIMEAGQQHFELTGELDIILGFQGSLKYPIDMWVLRPDRLEPVPDADLFLRGWVYTSPDGGSRIPIEPRELMRLTRPDPLNPYRGQSAIRPLMTDLDAQMFTKQYQAAFFANGAAPGGIITVDRRLQDDEFQEMSSRWDQQHRGASKAHRVAILEQATWQDSQISLKDLQLAELDAVGRDKALVAFGMPPSLIGIVEDVNRANAEAGEYVFAKHMEVPRLERWRAMFNQQLVPLFDQTGQLEMDFDSPVQEDSAEAIAALTAKSSVLVQLEGAGFDVPDVLDLLDWPDLGYEEKAPAPVVNPFAPAQPAEDKDEDEPPEDEDAELNALARERLIELRAAAERRVQAAMRWVVKGHPDDNCCEDCRKNLGKLYRNRQDAYRDYPPGQGYVNCIGAQYGNHCRCKVVKRRSSE